MQKNIPRLDLPAANKPTNLPVNKICISEPEDDNPKSPLTPETIERTPDDKPNKNQLTPTINEENELDHEQTTLSISNNKSSLSLPVEPLPTPVTPVERDRRKLSVQGIFHTYYTYVTYCRPFFFLVVFAFGSFITRANHFL